MTDLSQVLGVAGPLVAASGAAFLAYDAMKGPVRWYEQVFFARGRLKGFRELHEMTLRALKELPVPPYSAAEVETLAEAATKRYEGRASEAEEGALEREFAETVRSQNRAFWGFGLIVVGGVLQALSVLAW